MFLTLTRIKGSQASNFGNTQQINSKPRLQKIEAFMKCTFQQCCKLLIIGNSGKVYHGNFSSMHCLCVCVSVELGEATVYQAIHQSLQYGLNVCVSLLCSSLGSFHLLWLSNYCCCTPVQGMVLHSINLHFLFLALIYTAINLPMFLVASIIFGFCVISHAAFNLVY